MKQLLFTILLGCVSILQAQLQSGPMLGYADFQEVAIWLQTDGPAEVQIEYYPKSNPTEKHYTASVTTQKIDGYTATLIADEVKPSTAYEYKIAVKGDWLDIPYPLTFKTQEHWQYRKDPPAFSFLAGSCVYINDSLTDRPGKPYGQSTDIFKNMSSEDAEFMLWLGDNTYYREVDWNTRSGMLYRNTQTRSEKDLQPFLAKMHHYAIWDDHDYGPNNSDLSFWNKETSKEIFSLFWANPSYGIAGVPGISSMFTWNDIDFFLLDNRYNRSVNERKTGERSILGKEQLKWLKNALVSSQAPYKFVAMGGQFLNNAGVYESYTNYGFDKERQDIIDFIYAENIEGVIFIDGDRHHTELSKLSSEGKPTIWDITVSPLTSGAHMSDEINGLRVPETYVGEQNYAQITVSGTRKNRLVAVKIKDKTGKVIWTQELKK